MKMDRDWTWGLAKLAASTECPIVREDAMARNSRGVSFQLASLARASKCSSHNSGVRSIRLTSLALDSTLVIWGGEFGRLPVAEKSEKPGRDHNPHAMTYWFAGGGVKGGTSYGATDEVGHKAVDDRVNLHDLHATILHLLGMNHQQLTYRHNGRDFRLTDVEGEVIHEIIG
jgi:hypothetical protein